MRKLVAGLFVGASMLVAAPAQAAPVRPADPGFAGQWGLTQTRVDEAWSSTRGSSRVVVAVVDTGVSPLPELAGRLLPGKDFVNHDNNASDDNGHGTMAATVIAAAGNNRIGIAGVCWYCRILPVKVLNAKGGGSYTDIALGIRYAADRGAAVISLSLGGSDDSPLLRDAVGYAESRGALIVAAAGNRGVSTAHYPAAIPSVLAVGGVTPSGSRYDWSNHGSWVDVTAPGCNSAQGPTGLIGQYCGTSSATPFVAGVAGLLAATHPTPSAAQIRAALVASRMTRSGRIDVPSALRALPIDGDVTRPAVAFGPVGTLVRGRVTITAAAADQHGVSRVQLYAGGRLVATDTTAPYSFAWQSAPNTATVPLELRAYDRRGNLTVVRRHVRADNTGPVVRLAKAGRTLTVRATDPAGVARLELVVNGRITVRKAGASGRFVVPAKARRVVVRAYDRAGNLRVVNGKLGG
ncbi:S8 family serine peptidase [Paractinoplanes hotanensis]|uniref:S8 family serine peptidase n=1 Tax=Paractinoplanes hotanensis TaxID=2906497 RepID=A0ABT0Y1M1_9ACTN|nr:S8 family serine peptidase [Actinoplanes hotanensis]MCM4079872.1 S8 family serine peptidase [Actinoplanes hotanensis]